MIKQKINAFLKDHSGFCSTFPKAFNKNVLFFNLNVAVIPPAITCCFFFLSLFLHNTFQDQRAKVLS